MKKLLLFPILILLTVSVSAQSFNLKYNFKKGETYRYRDSSLNEITQELMGTVMKVTTGSNSVIRFVVEDNAPDGISLVTSFDSLVATTKTPQMDTTMVMEQLIGKKIRVILSDKGKILDKQIIDSIDSQGEMMQMGMGNSQFPRLPENQIKVGEKWNMTQVDTLDMMGGKTVITSDIEYTLQNKDEKLGIPVVKIPYTSKLKIEGKGSMMGFDFVLEGTGTAGGNLYFSHTMGVPVYSEANQNYDVTLAGTGEQNMIIPISQSMKVIRSLIK